jgi:hypothetical protein
MVSITPLKVLMEGNGLFLVLILVKWLDIVLVLPFCKTISQNGGLWTREIYFSQFWRLGSTLSDEGPLPASYPFLFWVERGLNSGLCTCKAGTLPLEPQLQFYFLVLMWLSSLCTQMAEGAIEELFGSLF